jgi:hypothetical protein
MTETNTYVRMIGKTMREEPASKCITCGCSAYLHPDPISAHAFLPRAEGCECWTEAGDTEWCKVHGKPAEPELRPGWHKEGCEYQHVSGGYIVAADASRGGYIGRAKRDTARWYGTLEFAMLAVERVAR